MVIKIKDKFIADGYRKNLDSNYDRIKSEITKEINTKFSAELSQSNLLRRIYLRYKMNKLIKRELEKRFSIESLY